MNWFFSFLWEKPKCCNVSVGRRTTQNKAHNYCCLTSFAKECVKMLLTWQNKRNGIKWFYSIIIIAWQAFIIHVLLYTLWLNIYSNMWNKEKEHKKNKFQANDSALRQQCEEHVPSELFKTECHVCSGLLLSERISVKQVRSEAQSVRRRADSFCLGSERERGKSAFLFKGGNSPSCSMIWSEEYDQQCESILAASRHTASLPPPPPPSPLQPLCTSLLPPVLHPPLLAPPSLLLSTNKEH